LGQPHWGFGTRTYAFVSPTQAVAAVGRQGSWSLASIDLESGEVQDLDTPYTEIHGVNAAAGGVVFIGGAPDRSPAVVLYDPASGECRELRRASSVEIDPGQLSLPEAIEFPLKTASPPTPSSTQPATTPSKPPTVSARPCLS
jgi:hypothetical protein